MFTNICMYEKTVAAVAVAAAADESLELLLKLLQMRDLFTDTCLLIGIMGFDDDRRKVSSSCTQSLLTSQFRCCSSCCRSARKALICLQIPALNNVIRACLMGIMSHSDKTLM